MRTYTLEVTGRQIVSLVLAISKLDEYLRSEGVYLDPPANPIIQDLMSNIRDKDESDLNSRIIITVDPFVIAAAYATSMTVLQYAGIIEPNVREDLRSWASCTAPMTNANTGTTEPHLN